MESKIKIDISIKSKEVGVRRFIITTLEQALRSWTEWHKNHPDTKDKSLIDWKMKDVTKKKS